MNLSSPMSAIPQTLFRRIAGWGLAIQPLFPVPVYISVLSGTPPLWLTLVIAVIPFALGFWLTRRVAPRTPFDVPILVFVVGMLVGLLVSQNKTIALGGLASTLASVLVYYGMVGNVQRGSRYWLSVAGVICSITLLLGIWFFSQGTARYASFNGWFFRLFEGLPKTEGPVLQFNSLGALLAVAIPALSGVAVFSHGRRLRFAALSLGLVFLAMLILSASGGGWIAALCGLAVLPLFWQKWTVFAIVPSAGITAALAAAFYGHAVWLRQVFSTGSLLERFRLWKNTLSLLSGQSTIVGLGLGGWAASYNSHFGEAQTHVHNSYLQLYADTGILGVVALALAAVVFLRLAASVLSSSRRQAWYGAGVGLTGAIVGGAAMATYDVTTTVTVVGTSSYVYLSVPLLWVSAALLVVSQEKFAAERKVVMPKGQRPPTGAGTGEMDPSEETRGV